MKIKLDQKIMNTEGIKPLPNSDKKGLPLTLKDVCINAILHPGKDDTGKQKYEAYELFAKIRDCKTPDIEMTIEEVVKIKAKIGDIYMPLILGQAWEMLEK